MIVDYVPAQDGYGPCYKLQGQSQNFNIDSILFVFVTSSAVSMADAASHKFGAGPGAVRFIDGTFKAHVDLERRIAEFTGRPAEKF